MKLRYGIKQTGSDILSGSYCKLWPPRSSRGIEWKSYFDWSVMCRHQGRLISQAFPEHQIHIQRATAGELENVKWGSLTAAWGLLSTQ